MKPIRITGDLIEIGDLEANRPGLRIDMGDDIVSVFGLTREQLMGLNAHLFTRITLEITLTGEAS